MSDIMDRLTTEILWVQVPDYLNKVNITIKWGKQIFLFLSAHKSYSYIILYYIKYETAYCLKKNVHRPSFLKLYY